METLEVNITPEDFRDAPYGYSNPYCVLRVALGRMFPGEYVAVGTDKVHLGKLPDQKVYHIDNSHWGDGTAIDGFSYNAINEFSAKAKISLDSIPSKTLYLQAHETLGLHPDDLSGAIVTRLANL